MRLGILIGAVLWAVIISSLTGCASALLGVKSYQSGDTRIDFITGADFSFGANGIDSVDNNRGISPKGGYRNKGEE